ncbi:MAG: sugar ABC transporter ATP-binding protein [candidate division WOR-3 bacterium]
MKKEILLRMEKISKSFPGVKALSGVDLEVYKGEVLALVGENGAGKTTLMEILNPHPAPTGFYIQDEGKIYFEGKEIKPKNPLDARKIGISFIHQNFNLVPNLSVYENMFLGRELRKMGFWGVVDKEEMRKLSNFYLNKLGVKISIDLPVSKLTVAQRQMLEIAKALSFQAKLIIMDEPTASLTENEIENLFRIVNKLKKEGVSFIFVTHKIEEVFKIADRVAVLRDGKMIGVLKIKEATPKKITKMMVGRELEEFPEKKREFGKEILKVKDLTKEGVLDRISFEVKEGEILGFYGLVGAGRTETMRAIFGLDKLDEGEIYVEGKKVQINSPKDAIKKGIILIPEDRQKEGFIPLMNIKENITLLVLREIFKQKIIREKKENAIVRYYINRLKINPPNPFSIVKGLSGGNQQKVIFAKGLASKPKLIILDEPTKGIDIGAKGEIHFLIYQLAGEGLGVIVVSSELPEVIKISDRIIVMAEGKIKKEFLKGEAREEEIVRSAVMG